LARAAPPAGALARRQVPPRLQVPAPRRPSHASGGLRRPVGEGSASNFELRMSTD